MLPTFILAGAPKSGTTTLWEFFQMHPDICTCAIKEPKYFIKANDVKPTYKGNYQKGLQWYQSLFKNCKSSAAIGEASGNYFANTNAPQLMKELIPNVTLVFILRDPVERIYSHYWNEIRDGRSLPEFNTLVKKGYPEFERYAYISTYQMHIQRYENYFSKEQINIFLFDDLQKKPRKLLKAVYKAINVNPDFLPEYPGKKFNTRRIPYFRWLDRAFFLLSTNYRMKTKQPPPYWVHNLAINILNRNSKIKSFLPMDKTTRKYLVSKFHSTVDFVETKLNRSLPAWRSF